MVKKEYYKNKAFIKSLGQYQSVRKPYKSVQDCSNSNLHSCDTLFWLKRGLNKGITEIVVWVWLGTVLKCVRSLYT